nr:MAG: major capsid protein [Microviridae sp.]
MNILNSIPLFRPRRNVFPSLMNENRLSTDMFRITPIAIEEAYADDRWHLRAEVFARVSPLMAPVMHRFDFRTYWFFVPYRILWDHYEEFFSGKEVTAADAPRVHSAAPKITISGNGFRYMMPKTLCDYLDAHIGLAPEDQASPDESAITKASRLHPNGVTISQLPLRAYQQIVNDYFIGASLSGPNEFDKGDDHLYCTHAFPEESGYEDEALARQILSIRYKSWGQDYFTSALPTPQRGPDVNAFDGGEMSVDNLRITGEGNASIFAQGISTKRRFALTDQTNPTNAAQSLEELIVANPEVFGFPGAEQAAYWVENNRSTLSGLTVKIGSSATTGNLAVDVPTPTQMPVYISGLRNAQNLTGSTIAGLLSITGEGSATIPAVTVEELRIRMQLQQWTERENLANGNGQGRYKQSLYAHWGVTGGDGRLQRAEFIGGSRQPVMINEISQMSAPTDSDPLGQLAGQGVSSSAGRGYRYRVPEHGFIIGLIAVTPRTAYMQGLRKFWTKFDRLDFYYPEFAHVGEEPIYYRELLNNGFNGDQVFGYNLRNADLKVRFDSVHGDLAGSLAHWTAARSFATPSSADDVPKLSLPFLIPEGSNPDDVDRIFPVPNSAFETTNADHFIVDVVNHTVASRLMPRYSSPRVG